VVTSVHQFCQLQLHVHGQVQLILANVHFEHANVHVGLDIAFVLLAVQHVQFTRFWVGGFSGSHSHGFVISGVYVIPPLFSQSIK
jgi:hypothetical protein